MKKTTTYKVGSTSEVIEVKIEPPARRMSGVHRFPLIISGEAIGNNGHRQP
jgi:hypothetical protein